MKKIDTSKENQEGKKKKIPSTNILICLQKYGIIQVLT